MEATQEASKYHGLNRYERHRSRMAEVARSESEVGREIGPLPPVVNPTRRAACEKDLERFCSAYAPHVFHFAFSDVHRVVIGRLQTVVLDGGLFAVGMPRGWGKTTLCQWAVIFALIYGHRRFVIYLGATTDDAIARVGEIMTELEENDLLLADFPEVCYPLRCLEGINQRAKGQRLEGEKTSISIGKKRIVLPTVAGSASSGAVIGTAGLNAAIRGRKETTRSLEVLRPDLVIPDDPQTDDSARSAYQVEQRLCKLNGSVLRLAGPGRRLAAAAPCTVIAPDDVADQLLDREKNPQWNGLKTAALESLPENEIIWAKYAEARKRGLQAEDGGAAANAFYREHQAALEAGATVVWPENVTEGDVSALQSIMHVKLDDEPTFWAELMMQPLSLQAISDANYDRSLLESRIMNPDLGVVPMDCPRLTAFVDPNSKLLWWMVVAWGQGFTGRILDYGVWPDQKTITPTNGKATRTLARSRPGVAWEAQLYGGLDGLVSMLATRRYPVEGSLQAGQVTAQLSVERILIDANWEGATDTVYQFCRESDHAGLLTPSHGRGIKPGQRTIDQLATQPGDRVGHHWRARMGKRGVRFVIFDANRWKSFIASRFHATHPEPGSLTIGRASLAQHRTLLNHLLSEYAETKEADEQRMDMWFKRNGEDNDWFDGLIGCAVAASMGGVSTIGHVSRPKKRRRRRVGYF